MIALKDKQYILDIKGKPVAVLLDVATYENFLEALEGLEDIRAYDKVKEKVKAEVKSGKSITLQEYLSKRRKKGK